MNLDEKTPEQIALEKEAHQAVVISNRRYRALKNKLIKECKEDKGNLRVVELRLEFLKGNKDTPVPYNELTRERTIECFEEAIEEFKSSLTKKNKHDTNSARIYDMFADQCR